VRTRKPPSIFAVVDRHALPESTLPLKQTSDALNFGARSWASSLAARDAVLVTNKIDLRAGNGA
jgi:hypothetical protein